MELALMPSWAAFTISTNVSDHEFVPYTVDLQMPSRHVSIFARIDLEPGLTWVAAY